MIPFFDLKQQTNSLKHEILKDIEKVIDECAFSGGKYVERFEESFASFCGSPFAVGVNSGTSALHLALLSLGIGEGDEVLLPANSFVATAWAVSYVGARPVFVDCDPKTWNMDVKNLEDKITEKTRAIICVHLYGCPCDMEKLLAIKEANDLYLVEDCAQAHGAEFQGQKVGNFGEAAAFSFYPGKNLGAFGEAGAVITNDRHIAERIKRLRDHGSSRKYYHDEIGYNMRMDGIQGAVLDIKLKYLTEWNQKRQEIAQKYLDAIEPVQEEISPQKILDDGDSVYHLFVVTVKNRPRFIEHLEENGVSVGQHYPVPIHLQRAYEYLKHLKGDFPNAEYLSEHCVSLPMYPELNKIQVDKVIEVCRLSRDLTV